MRTILISGASRGIGKAIALKAIENGHRVSLGLRNTNDLEGTLLDPQKSKRKNIFIYKYDANSTSSAKDWVNATKEIYGGFDTLINCAGIFRDTEFIFKDNQFKDIDDLLKINLLGPWILTKEAWPQLCKGGKGRVQFLVSMSGKRSKGKLAGYSVSKFALMGLCQTIRNEGWEQGIRVTAISPSWVNTNMAKNVKTINKSEMTQPVDIASISCSLLELPNSSIPFEININCNLEK